MNPGALQVHLREIGVPPHTVNYDEALSLGERKAQLTKAGQARCKALLH